MARQHDVLVIIPAYNESQNIVSVLDGIEAAGMTEIADVLVIDDASTDGTGFLAERPGCSVIMQVYNMGYGSALQTGYKYAFRRGYEYVIQMDADGQHDVCNIERIYSALTTPGRDGLCPDIVLGSRFLNEENELVPDAKKKLAIGYFRWLIKLFTGQYVTDPTSGLQGLSRRTFTYYSEFDHFDERYPDANMVTRMILMGARLIEIPAVMHERKSGKSMHTGLLRNIVYMALMTINVVGAAFRFGALHEDRGRI